MSTSRLDGREETAKLPGIRYRIKLYWVTWHEHAILSAGFLLCRTGEEGVKPWVEYDPLEAEPASMAVKAPDLHRDKFRRRLAAEQNLTLGLAQSGRPSGDGWMISRRPSVHADNVGISRTEYH